MDIIFICLAAILGALFTAVLGWINSGEPFVIRKFMGSVLAAILAAVAAGIAFQYIAPPTVRDFIMAFLAGAALDAGGKRVVTLIQNAITNSTTTPAPPPNMPPGV